MKNKLFLIGILTLIFYASAFSQLNLPRDSQRSEIAQIIGDTRVSIVYHRPAVKGRKVWGEAPPAAGSGTSTLDTNTRADDAPLVAYGHVWRTGANENTTFEISGDIKINGQTLPAGKYGLHTIPNKNEWTIIFSKVSNAWGSFSYDAKNDQLRITAKPQTTTEFQETLSLELENVKATTADVVIAWEKIRVPFTIDVGDVTGRTLAEIRRQISNIKTGDSGIPTEGAAWVLQMHLSSSYPEALEWIDSSIGVRETFGKLSTKAQILATMGKKQEAIATAEKAIQIGKLASPSANTAGLEKMLLDWKAGK